MIVTRPIHNGEPDLLVGFECLTLTIQDLDGNEVAKVSAPNGHWTHDALESLDIYAYSPNGWNAYLDNHWIGSSEV
ncbi:hypothetical protein L5L78_08005 [Shewanella sp. SM34]|uniref:hypothetical protein n=1 Tax=unclassified Shewanella TaxID=196818 RepID=UPI0021D8B970|nr:MULTISPECIES: hypothetical protein [unclassified Shewanella]MCU8056142.1 hypothetical protein [Shewanella sp. SM35]MCU8065076.1 hypothetical protein [Shewanella sp. SM34]